MLYLDVYGHNKNVRKSLAYLAMVHKTPSTFTLMDRNEHAWKKRILSQKLSDSAIRSFEPKITGMIDRFCEYVCPVSAGKENTVSKPFNMSEMCKLNSNWSPLYLLVPADSTCCVTQAIIFSLTL